MIGFLFSERGTIIESRAKRELSLSIIVPTVDLSIVNILFTWDNFYFIITVRKEYIMTRKDYEKFVDVIKDYTVYQWAINKDFNYYPLVNLFIGVFSADNHRFNSDRFRSAVNMAINKVTVVQSTCINGAVHESQEITTILNNEK